MEDEEWLEDIFKNLSNGELEMHATALIDEWMNGETCNMICDDANDGCEESRKFIDDLCLMMDSATFHMNQAEPDYHRIDKELSGCLMHINSIS
jgi:hypothetical protein